MIVKGATDVCIGETPFKLFNEMGLSDASPGWVAFV